MTHIISTWTSPPPPHTHKLSNTLLYFTLPRQVPRGDLLGVEVFSDVWLPLGVKLPVVAALEEVDLAVTAPDKGGVEVGGDAGEAPGHGLGVAGAWPHVLELPVLAGLEEVRRLGLCPCEGRVQAARQAGPVLEHRCDLC